MENREEVVEEMEKGTVRAERGMDGWRGIGRWVEGRRVGGALKEKKEGNGRNGVMVACCKVQK